MDEMRLESGATVAIIGGGPAGSAAAIALLQGARVRGLHLRVVLCEGKYFKVHHNQCVGVLSPPLEDILASELGLSLPEGLVKRRIYGYRLHAGGNELFLVGDEKEGPTYTVHRVDFDHFMLRTAMDAGAEVNHARVTGLEFVGRPVREVRVYAEAGYIRADAVICAFGVDEGMLGALEQATRHTVGYRRPGSFLRTFVTKLDTRAGFIERRLGNSIRAYLMPPEVPGIEFGAISPKQRHIVVNIAGGRVTSEDLDAFLELPCVRAHLPEFRRESLAYFEGRFPTAPARHCYGDRFAVVGDATGWLRPFKGKGITTAVVTGIRAARTMLEHGISGRDFRKYEESCRELLSDYTWGAAVRWGCRLGGRLGVFRPLLELGKVDEILYDALYDSVSGNDSYRHIMSRLLRPSTIWRLGSRLLRQQAHGRRDTSMKAGKMVRVRRLTPRDFEAILAIERKLHGRPQSAYWESKLAGHIERDPSGCLAAEVGERVVGFMVGEIRGWEFHLPLSGWIEVMAVDPEFQGRGVGRALVAGLFDYFRQAGIVDVNALIDWNDTEVVEYLRSIGFHRGEYVHLKRHLEPEATGGAVAAGEFSAAGASLQTVDGSGAGGAVDLSGEGQTRLARLEGAEWLLGATGEASEQG